MNKNIEFLVPNESQPALFEVRSLLEGQNQETLAKWKEEALSDISDLEKLVHMINDVEAGNGFTSE